MYSQNPTINSSITKAYQIFSDFSGAFETEWDEKFELKKHNLFDPHKNSVRVLLTWLGQEEESINKICWSESEKELIRYHFGNIYETIIRLCLQVYSKVPTSQLAFFLPHANVLVRFLSDLYSSHRNLFDYLVDEFRIALRDLSRAEVPFEFTGFRKQNFGISVTCNRIKFTPMVLNTRSQIETLIITCCHIVKNIGLPVVSSMGMKTFCEFSWSLVRSCTRSSIDIVVASIDLFIKRYPVKCIKLDPKQGFFELIVKLTCIQKSLASDPKLFNVASCGWKLLLIRINIEKQNITCRPLELVHFFISLVNLLSTLTHWVSSSMFNWTLPQIFVTLLQLIKVQQSRVSDTQVRLMLDIFRQRLCGNLPFNSKWPTVICMFLSFTEPYLSQDNSVDGNSPYLGRNLGSPGDRSFVVNSQPAISSLESSSELVELLFKDFESSINGFLRQYETQNLNNLHDLICTQWEMVISSSLTSYSPLNVKSLHQLVKLADKICSILESPGVSISKDEAVVYFHLILLFIELTYPSELRCNLRGLRETQGRIVNLLFIPFCTESTLYPQNNRYYWQEFKLYLPKENLLLMSCLALKGLSLIQVFPDPELKATTIIENSSLIISGADLNTIWSYFIATTDISSILPRILSMCKEDLMGQVIGLVACGISSSKKSLEFDFDSPYNSIYLRFTCSVCDDHDQLENTDLTREHLDNLLERFEEIVKKRSHLANFTAVSVSRIFKHCGIRKSTVLLIFSLLNVTDEDTVTFVRQNLVPPLISAYKTKHLHPSLTEDLVQLLIESSKEKKSLTEKESRVFIENLFLIATSFKSPYSLLEILILICQSFVFCKKYLNTFKSKIENLFEERNITVEAFINNFQRRFYMKLAEASYKYNLIVPGYSLGFMKLSLSLFYDNCDKIPTTMIDSLFSVALAAADEFTDDVVNDIVSFCSLPKKNLLNNYLMFYPKFLVGLPREQIKRSLELYEKLRNEEGVNQIEIERILLENYTNIENVGFIISSLYLDRECPISSDNYFTEKVQAIINSEFGGYLIAFNGEMKRWKEDSRQKCELLRGLVMLLNEKVLNSVIVSKYKINIIGTLVTAYSRAPKLAKTTERTLYMHLLFTAWSNFLQLVDPNEFGPHLPVACDHLLVFFDTHPEETANVVENLILDNEMQLQEYFRHLHFLPKNDLFKRVWAVIDHSLLFLRVDQSKMGESVREILDIMAKELLMIDNPEVKTRHLNKLKSILDAYSKGLHQLRYPNKEATTSSSLTLLVRKLLLDSSVAMPNLSTQIACCLGEIGAIDPGRLDLSLLSCRGNSLKEETFVLKENIPSELLVKLSSALESTKEARIRDCLCYGIQECVKKFNFTEEDERWQSLPSHVQMCVKQYFNTRYTVIESLVSKNEPLNDSNMDCDSGSQANYAGIFHESISYDTWIVEWALKLINLIKDSVLKEVLESFQAALRFSPELCRLLLPIVFWLAMGDSTEEKIDCVIVLEFNTILFTGCDQKVYLSATQHPLTSTFEKVSAIKEKEEKARFRCARTMFSLLDYLNLWKSSSYENDSMDSDETQNIRTKIDFLNGNLDKSSLAELAYECHAFSRALKYMEEFVEENLGCLDEKMEFLQKYYVALGEPDAVEGFNTLRSKNPSLKDTILNHEANNQLQYSLSCCEVAISKEPADVVPYKALLNSLISLGQHNTALNYSKSLCHYKKNWSRQFYPYMLESSIKLNSWLELNSIIKENDTLDCFEVGLGHLFNCIHRNDRKRLEEICEKLRVQQMDYLAASPLEEGAYIRGYQHILHLHTIADIEKFCRAYFGSTDASTGTHSQNFQENEESFDISDVLEQWRERNEIIQPTLRCKDPILSVQRALLSFDGIYSDSKRDYILIQKSGLILTSAKLARKSQNLQRAYGNLVELQELLNSSKSLPKSLNFQLIIEKAKFEWAKGDQEAKEKCVDGLQMSLNQFKSDSGDELYGKMKLMHVDFCEKLVSLRGKDMLTMYKEVVDEYGNWEDSHFAFAKYYDRLLQNLTPDHKYRANFMLTAGKHYGLSLKYGCKHVNESMPRLLHLWCDHGLLMNPEKAYDHDKFAKLMREFMQQLPSYFFYLSISQLLSRLGHSNLVVNIVLELIIEKLLLEYPHQMMWNIIGILLNVDTSNKTRADICRKIIFSIKKDNRELAKFLADFEQLCRHFNTLARLKSTPAFSLNRALPSLAKLFSKGNLSEIMLPYQDYLTAKVRAKYDQDSSFSPFPSQAVYIRGFEDKVHVFHSFARPKKLGIKCSDGRTYYVLCKPNDDLRKDAKAIEFANLVNRLLKKHPETRSRQLQIRTYTVIPLGQDGGLVEWVSDLATMKSVIHTGWPIKNPNIKFPIPTPPSLSKEWTEKSTASDAAKRCYLKVVNRYKPASNAWFSLKFPDPTSWHMARLSYTKSCAVMSIAGYLIGLGDRHLENICIKSDTGECIHVDFNLLLFGGESLAVPERVPFRLTKNMIAPMGCSEWEGVFRKTCEATLSVLRAKKAQLLSVLLPLVFDHESEKIRKTRNTPATASFGDSRLKTNETIKRIENHLDGIIDSISGVPVSVSGQVRYLIDEATSPANLGKMFIGWTAFL